MQSQDTKTCRVCGTEKPWTDFPPKARMRDGLDTRCRECFNAYHREWSAKKRAENPNWDKEKQRRWEQANPEAAVARRAARYNTWRYHQINAEGKLTAAVVADVKRRDGRYLCCGAGDRLTVDHVVPLSRGGTNLPDNLQTLCLSCNSRKHAQTIDYRVDSPQIPRD